MSTNATYAAVPQQEAPAAPRRFDGVRSAASSAYTQVHDVIVEPPPYYVAPHHCATYPVNGGFTGRMSLEVITFPELDEHVPQGEILRTIAGINAILREQGPRYHLPIFVGTTVLLVAGGVVVGVIAAVAAGIYFKVKKGRALRVMEEFLRAENDKPCYQQAGIRWHFSNRGVEMEHTGWEMVDVRPAAAPVAGVPQPAPVASAKAAEAGVPAYSPAPAATANFYPAVPVPQAATMPPAYATVNPAALSYEQQLDLAMRASAAEAQKNGTPAQYR